MVKDAGLCSMKKVIMDPPEFVITARMVYPNIATKKGREKMKLPFKGLKIISPSFWAAFFVLANLFFCTGCENKQAIKIGDTPPVISGN